MEADAVIGSVTLLFVLLVLALAVWYRYRLELHAHHRYESEVPRSQPSQSPEIHLTEAHEPWLTLDTERTVESDEPAPQPEPASEWTAQPSTPSPPPVSKSLDELVAALQNKLEKQRTRENPEQGFYFLDVAKLIGCSRLPVFQEAKRQGLLVREKVSLKQVIRGEYKTQYLAVSHKWVAADQPDPTSQQLGLLMHYLKTDPHGQLVTRVWYDWSCMPQDERTLEEKHNKTSKDTRSAELKQEFDEMLKLANFLYVGCRVLILADLPYLTSFVRETHVTSRMLVPLAKPQPWQSSTAPVSMQTSAP